jgi:hypothetical protein
MAEQGSEQPGAVKGAPVLGTAQRTLDGEDRSETIVAEGKATRFTHGQWLLSPAITATEPYLFRERTRRV